MSDRVLVELTINGTACSALVEPRRTLADAIRSDFGLTGTHVACEHGVCGACTVLLGDQPIRSCLMLAVQANGASLTTVEGVGGASGLHPLQEAFRDCVSFQCGFCTPGFVMSGIAFLRENPRPSREEIRTALASNLCRCTGYAGIVDAVQLAAERIASSRDSADADG